MSDYTQTHYVLPGERVPAGPGVVFLIVVWLVMAAWFVPFALVDLLGIVRAVS